MNRRQLAFIILFNAIISLVIVLIVVWAVESRRPDPEELLILATPALVQPVSQPTMAAIESATTENPAATTSSATVVEAEVVEDVGETEAYTVQSGDSLSSIADRFRVPVDTLVRINELPNPDYVFVGQRLLIPVGAGNDGSELIPTATVENEPITDGVFIRAVEGPADLLAEAVQVANDLNRVVNLAGWVLGREGGASYTFDNLPLFAGNYIWLHTRAGEDTSIAVYWDQESAAWSSGTIIQLRNPQGTVVSTFTVP